MSYISPPKPKMNGSGNYNKNMKTVNKTAKNVDDFSWDTVDPHRKLDERNLKAKGSNQITILFLATFGVLAIIIILLIYGESLFM